MKISELIHKFETHVISSPAFDSLIKETINYLTEYAKNDNGWDLKLLDELEEEQCLCANELITKINNVTLTLAQNSVVPIVECDPEELSTISLPAIETKSRRLEIDTSFEEPLICILKLAKSAINTPPNQDLIITISRLLQAYLTNCLNIQLSTLWDEEYWRTVRQTITREHNRAFSKKHELAREAFRSYVFSGVVLANTPKTMEELISDAASYRNNLIDGTDSSPEMIKSWDNVGDSIITIWAEVFYKESLEKLSS